MAGSYRHLVNGENREIVSDTNNGDEPFPLIENMGDAQECIAELFDMIQHLSGGDLRAIFEAHMSARNVHPSMVDLSDEAFLRYWRD